MNDYTELFDKYKDSLTPDKIEAIKKSGVEPEVYDKLLSKEALFARIGDTYNLEPEKITALRNIYNDNPFEVTKFINKTGLKPKEPGFLEKEFDLLKEYYSPSEEITSIPGKVGAVAGKALDAVGQYLKKKPYPGDTTGPNYPAPSELTPPIGEPPGGIPPEPSYMGSNALGPVNLSPGAKQFAMELPAMAATGGAVSSLIPGAGMVPAAKMAVDALAGGTVYGAGKAALQGKSVPDTLSEAGRMGAGFFEFGAVPTVAAVGVLGALTKTGKVFSALSDAAKATQVPKWTKSTGIDQAAEYIKEGSPESIANADAIIKNVAKKEAQTPDSIPIVEDKIRTIANGIANGKKPVDVIKTELKPAEAPAPTAEPTSLKSVLEPSFIETARKKVTPEIRSDPEFQASVNARVNEMIDEVKGAEAGKRLVLQADQTATGKAQGFRQPSTFPKWFSDLGYRDKRQFFASVSNPKTFGKVVDLAEDHVINGYKSSEYGYLPPTYPPDNPELQSYMDGVQSFDNELNKDQIVHAQSESPLDQAQAQNMKETAPGWKKAQTNQEGFFGLFGKGKAEKVPEDLKANNPALESVLASGDKQGNLIARTIKYASNKIKTYQDSVGKAYFYEYAIKQDPALVNSLRLFKSNWSKSKNFSTNSIMNIMGPDIFKDPEQYEMFRRMFAVRDIKNEINAGRDTSFQRYLSENKMDPAQAIPILDKQMADYQAIAKDNGWDQTINSSIARHDRFHQGLGLEMEARGVLPPGTVAKNPQYFRHEVKDFIEGLEDRFPGVQPKLKEPYSPYTFKREGTGMDINYDYANQEMRYLSKVFMDQAHRDLLSDLETKYDILPNLTDAERSEMFKATGGQPRVTPQLRPIYHWQGQNYVAIQPNPGNMVFKGLTTNKSKLEDILMSTLDSNLNFEEFAKQFKEALIIGPKKPVIVVPDYVAERMGNFKNPPDWNRHLRLLWDSTNLWKRLTLDLSGISYQMHTFMGHMMNMSLLYRTRDMGELFKPSNWWKAFNMSLLATKKVATPAEYDAMESWIKSIGFMDKSMKDALPYAERAQAQEVTKSGPYQSGELGFSNVASNPVWNKVFYLNQSAPKRLLNNLLSPIEFVSNMNFNIPRTLDFAIKLKQIDAGKMPYLPDWINTKDLTSEAAAGLANRTVLIDYTAVSPKFAQQIRGLMFPFATFALKNAPVWYKYAVNQPGDFMARYAATYGMTWIWNNSGERRKIEATLPDYMKDDFHIICPWKDENGKVPVVTIHTSLDYAMRLSGGMDKWPSLVEKLRNKEITPEEAVKEGFVNIVKSPFGMAKEFLNPLLKVIIGSVTNNDINTGKEIVPDRLKGTDVGNRMKWQWVANQIHSPMGPFFERVRDQMYRPEAGAPSFGQQIAPVAEKWARARIDPSQALVKRVDVGRGAEKIASELKQKEEKIKINTEYELKDKMVGILANNRFTLGQPISPAVQQTLSKIMNDYLMKGKIREPDKSILFKDEAPRVPGEVRGVFSFAKLNQITQMQIFKEALDEQAYRAEGRPAEQKLLKNQSDQLSKVIQIMQLQKEQKMNQPISAERMGDTQQFQQSIPGGE